MATYSDIEMKIIQWGEARGIVQNSTPKAQWHKTVEEVERRVEHIKTPLTISILGCVVNGLGEAAHTQIGITGGGSNRHNVYINGKPNHKVSSDELVDHIVGLIEQEAKNAH